MLSRLEQYDNCFTVYRDIIRSSIDNKYETERNTNLSTTLTAQRPDKSKMVVDEIDSFDQSFNARRQKTEKILVLGLSLRGVGTNY